MEASGKEKTVFPSPITSEYRISSSAVIFHQVSIGELAVNPDEQGYFQMENIPIGDQVVRFLSAPAANLVSQDETGIDAEYLV
jgi:hypothetical protein